ncbi:MAG TPA: DUF3106 domain-containing protein [Candidatus Polarisedimenticolia bacterium]|nr:DUF3106 domain-containing protein [Candidatus Polarisedimenticolia bacterium]
MRRKLQFTGWLIALGVTAALSVPAFAQGPRANWAQNRQDNKPPKQQSQPQRQQPPRQQQRQEQKRDNRQQRQGIRRAQNERQNSGANRPQSSKPNRADLMGTPNINPNRPPSAYTPPPQKRFNQLSPQEQRKVVENYNKQRNLSPADRQEIKKREEIFGRLTPEQKDHVRNDLAPKWKQLPPNRQRAIQQRLGVLQNMPESARNQHLNDPNFTRGMSEEDKAMLRDLSHLHVGAPDPPNE